MKKILALALTMALSFSMVACGAKTEEASVAEEVAEEVPAEEATEEAVEAPVAEEKTEE